jgi:hypothetical protein
VASADLKPAATLNMNDLENVVDILHHPAFLFHYLNRCAEVEARQVCEHENLPLFSDLFHSP